MKKLNLIFLLILLSLLSIIIIFALNKKNSETKILDGVNKSDVNINTDEKYYLELPDNNIKYLTYKYSIQAINNNQPEELMVYEDELQNEFSMDKDNQIRSIMFYNVSLCGEKISEDRIKELSIKRIQEFFDISEYDIEFYKADKTDISYYNIKLSQSINGIRTNDVILVKVNSSAELINIVSTGSRVTPEIKDFYSKSLKEELYISKDDALLLLNTQLKKDFIDIKLTDIKIEEPTLSFNKDMKLVWTFPVEINHRNTENQEPIYINACLYTIDAYDKTITIIN